jgi:hypothetical protein
MPFRETVAVYCENGNVLWRGLWNSAAGPSPVAVASLSFHSHSLPSVWEAGTEHETSGVSLRSCIRCSAPRLTILTLCACQCHSGVIFRPFWRYMVDLGDVPCILLAQAVVNKVMNRRVWATVSFSRRTQLHAISSPRDSRAVHGVETVLTCRIPRDCRFVPRSSSHTGWLTLFN